MSEDERPKPLVYKIPVTKALEEVFSTLPSLFEAELSHEARQALLYLQEFTLRPSKRVRGALAAFAYDFVTKKQFAPAGLQAGAALELAQSYLLIIDDVMDKSELRRGKPSLHQLYRQQQTDTHTADMLAINVGLVAQHMLNIVLMDVDENPTHVRHATKLLHKNIALTGFGQLDDLVQQITSPVTEQEIIRKYILKSSYYTFVNPLQVGLALAGVDDEVVYAEIESFGVAAGIAFQLQDDLLGIFGQATTLGKSNLDDIKEGKCTLLMQHALSRATAKDAAVLKEALGNPDVTEDILPEIQDILERSGSRASARSQVTFYANQAKTVLEDSTFWDDTARQALRELVDFIVAREM